MIFDGDWGGGGGGGGEGALGHGKELGKQLSFVTVIGVQKRCTSMQPKYLQLLHKPSFKISLNCTF